MVTIEDCVEAEEIVKADEGIRALLKDRYGITDMSMVAADPWFYGDRFGERHICPYLHLHPPCSDATRSGEARESACLTVRFLSAHGLQLGR